MCHLGLRKRLLTCAASASALCLLLVQERSAGAQIVASPPASHPIYVSVPDAAMDDSARKTFVAAAAKFGLGPVETADLPDPPAPVAAKGLTAAVARCKDLSFDEAQRLLVPALAEAEATGAAGLSQEQLCDLHLYSAMALDRADWRDLPEAGPAAPAPEAWRAYLASAVLCPGRQLYQRTFPPLALVRYAAAVAEVQRRGAGVLYVQAASDALICIDGRPCVPSPASLAAPYGEHFIRVQRPGRLPWTQKVPLTLSRLEIDVPDQTFKTYSDNEAAAHARRMSAAFALVAELKPGNPVLLELRLVDVPTGRRIDSTRVPVTGEVGGVHAAVMRLDEQARRRDLRAQQGHDAANEGAEFLIAPAPTKASDGGQPASQDPSGWAQKRWPMLVAVGVVVATSLVLSLAVALDDKMAVQ